jgi:ATP-dependent helicase YprA (DUF1998 family)
MSRVRMEMFGDDGALTDPSSAEWARTKKLPGATELDFVNVTRVTMAFLDALFAGMSPDQIVEFSPINATHEVDATLQRWLDRTPVVTVPAVQRPAPMAVPKAPTPTFAQSTGPDARYTPTRLMRRLREQLEHYIEAAYPLNDTRLIQARRKLLVEHDGGHLLAQEPFVETTPRYTAYDGSFLSLDIASETATFLDSLTRANGERAALLHPELYRHQADAINASLGAARKNLIVATGTGSGKTECFLLPMIGALHEEARTRPTQFAKRGVRALILYPMNALVNDQLSRLRRLLGDDGFAEQFRATTGSQRHPVFGMYTGRTPYAGPRTASKDGDRVEPLLTYYRDLDLELADSLRAMGRYPSKDLRSFLAEDAVSTKIIKSGKKKGQTQPDNNWKQRLRTASGDRELLTRHEMIRDASTGQGAAPDVLITNYSMLEYMLMRPFERPLFDETRAWLQEPGSRLLLVLDEAHMYRGAKGAEVAFLLRRLLARLGVIGHPDKVSVICTSASLGDRDDAKENAARFAADLTGQPIERFAVVTGTRAKPSNPKPGDGPTAAVLAAIDLDALHNAADVDALRGTLGPLFTHLGVSPPEGNEAAVLAALHDTLQPQPFVHELLTATSGRAMSLSDLSQRVFPDSEAAVSATQALLTLGAIARRTHDAPGLLPTRLHMMFRGLEGLYACIREACPGRQVVPGENAPLGKLFVEARTHCDAEGCGARVFEIASCRECGAAYLLAYSPVADLHDWRFLWGETAEHGTCVQLLPTAPPDDDRTHVVSVHLRSGNIVDPGTAADANEVRDLWVACKDAEHVAEFNVCPMCQPVGSQRDGRIRDFRTRGEQPFTTLIETQFAEQPPQKHDPTLANQGRKVLVFSDGRQKAARLAPALSVSHAQDAFRQVLVLAAKMLVDAGEVPSLAAMFPAVLKVCAERSIDLFPNADESDWRKHLASARTLGLQQLLLHQRHHMIAPTLGYAQALFAELTERYLSLPQLTIGGIELHPLHEGLLFKSFPAIGLDSAQVRTLVRNWIRTLLEHRCLLPPGGSRWKLGEQFQRPEGLTTRKRDDLAPRRFRQWIEAILGDAGHVAQVLAWLESIADRGLFVTSDDLHYLSLDALVLRLQTEGPWWRCTRCNRLHGAVLGAPAPLCDECRAELVDTTHDEDFLSSRVGYYRDAVNRALRKESIEPFGLTVEEHTAQLTGMEDEEAFNRTERYELRFQDLRIDNASPIDVLSCTTTMEVGIDIGSLCGVALRNVPPHVANYQQRAGRAGRRGRAIASVITYAQGGSHDAWFYGNPDRIISGDVRAPVVYVENQKVLERHIRAWLVQRFFHDTVAGNAKAYALFESMGTVGDFLDDTKPCSLAKLDAWMKANDAALLDELRAWVPRESHALGRAIDVDVTLDATVHGLLDGLRAALPLAAYAQRESLDETERAALEMLLSENLLQALINRAFFPRYAFPTDTVSFWVPKPRGANTPKYKLEFDYQPQRDLQVALSEYAPGRSLTIDRLRFSSAALYNPYQPDVSKTLRGQRLYASCSVCGFVRVGTDVAKLPACPVCGNADLARRPFVRPEGFAPDVNVAREPDRGGAISWAGQSTPAKIEVTSPNAWDETHFSGRLRLLSAPRELVVVNKGNRDLGFMVCPQCGLAEWPLGPGSTRTKLSGKGAAKTHGHPTKVRTPCSGTAEGPFFLGHQFQTDVLLMRLRFDAPMQCSVTGSGRGPSAAGRAALTSLVEALSLAASRTLQIDEGELAGNWNPVPNGDPFEADVYLYDLLPGGAGYTHQVRGALDEVFAATRTLLSDCTCASSCYRCLRHYGNQTVHGQLDRNLALALLDGITTGHQPTLDPGASERALDGLREVLRLRSVPFSAETVDTPTGSLAVPLVLERPNGAVVWVTVHHPLLDPEAAAKPLLTEAVANMVLGVPIDAYTLVNDLPAAVALVLGIS